MFPYYYETLKQIEFSADIWGMKPGQRFSPRIAGVIALASLIFVSFQNCSQKGFSTGIKDQSSNAGAAAAPSPSPAANSFASYTIAPSAPKNLSQSGVLPMMENSPGINFMQFTPQYPLYSDNAAKRRFIYLPKDSRVNTADLDAWVFPKGTVLWKEFSINNKKVETRVWEKTSESFGVTAWRPSVYLWKADQSDAVLQEVDDFYAQDPAVKVLYQAGQLEASNTYKVLKLSSCTTCHSSNKDVALGFNYLGLSNNKSAVNIFSLKAKGLLLSPPLVEDSIKGSDAAKAAIGYMQTNCATCHNGVTNNHNWKHVSTAMNYNDEQVVKDLVANPGNTSVPVITAGDITKSRAYIRMVAREMPKLGMFTSDPDGVRFMAEWINDGNIRACGAPQTSSSCTMPVGAVGDFAASTSMRVDAIDCQQFCMMQMKARTKGNYCCQYVPKEATPNSLSVCTVSNGTVIASTTPGYSASACSMQ